MSTRCLGSVCLIGLLTLTLAGCRSPEAAAGPNARTAKAGAATLPALKGGRAYQDAKNGFSIEFPAEWTIKPDFMGAKVAALSTHPTDGFAINANVVVVNDRAGVTPEQAVQAATKMLGMMMTDYKLVEEHYGPIQGRDAAWIVSTYRMGRLSLKAMAFMVGKGGKFYTVTCTASPASFDSARPTFEGIGGSIKIL